MTTKGESTKGTDMDEQRRAKADRAYCDYVEQMSRPECLGWRQKVKDGTFGDKELAGHKEAARLLGRHQAFAEAAITEDALRRALEEIVEVASGKKQVAQDDTEGMAWIDRAARAALREGL